MEHIYASCACNRTPHSTDWGFCGLIAYGSSHAINIYNPKSPAIIKQILTGHVNRVNCVKWIQINGVNTLNDLKEDELVSGSTDNTCIVWKRKGDGKFEEYCKLEGHTGSINTIDAVTFGTANTEDVGAGDKKVCNQRTIIVSASVDSTVKIWQRKEEGERFTCMQTLTFGTGFALDVAVTVLPQSEVVMLACAGDDQRVHIFLEQNSQFVSVETLLGHEDWVRGLSFAHGENGDVLLASCSQDYYIRIWRFSPRDSTEVHSITKSVALLSLQDDIKLKENAFAFQKINGECGCYAVRLESVLQGHDNWVYSVRWQPVQITEGMVHQPMCLLSASMDKTMIMWKPDPQSGLWLEHARVGEVGGNSLGFYGGVFSPDGLSILSHGYQGAFELRTFNKDSDTWEPCVTCGGHFDAVHDISWQPGTGHFLLSMSSDQTTRCHGYWKSACENERSWHEVARPQIHGYDMQCIAMINRYMYASGADEKVIRCFEAPKNFVETLSRISSLDLSKDIESRPEGAAVPCLGLSNKAVYEGGVEDMSAGRPVESHPNEQYPENYFIPVNTHQPPSEVDLLQNTLWPEVHKLYGHGYEIFALACNPQGTILASACKAAKAEHAGIMLWDCSSWRLVDTLLSHSLTVTQLQFSHSGQFLLSVSRDRTWSLFSNTGNYAVNDGFLG